ncbi:MAG: phosphoribosylglycinamide formyltransferase [Trueperella sp.]|nr:phosphoribosylglycinamide formyltransferase [Trueperella sp.]
MKARVAVLVSGSGTNLQALLDAAAAGKLPDAQIDLVISDRPGAYALQRATQAGVNTAVLSPRQSEATPESFAEQLLAALADIDLVVLAGYLTIIPQAVVRQFAGRIINIHPSLIPAFCGPGWYGLHVHEGVLHRGVQITGATVHEVTDEVDGGQILAQKAVAVQAGDTPETLQRRVMEEAEWQILPAVTQQLAKQIVEGAR